MSLSQALNQFAQNLGRYQRIQVGMEVDARGFVRADDGELVSVDAEDLVFLGR